MSRKALLKPPEYSAEFEAMWSTTAKTGSKSDAQVVWLKVGSPSAAIIGPAWKLWEAYWDGIGVKHVSRWLRAFDWQQTPTKPVNGNAMPAPKPSAPVLNLCQFHADQKNMMRPTKYLKPDICSDCKHLSLKNRPATDNEPTPIGELWNGKP